MRSTFKHRLWDVDAKLFESIQDNYQSENERRFFEYLHNVELWDCCMSGDLLLHEDDNEDGLYIMRIEFDEYEVGRTGREYKDFHAMNLSEALNLNLKNQGLLRENITLGEWLKARDYEGVRYDQNRDFQ